MQRECDQWSHVCRCVCVSHCSSLCCSCMQECHTHTHVHTRMSLHSCVQCILNEHTHTHICIRTAYKHTYIHTANIHTAYIHPRTNTHNNTSVHIGLCREENDGDSSTCDIVCGVVLHQHFDAQHCYKPVLIIREIKRKTKENKVCIWLKICCMCTRMHFARIFACVYVRIYIHECMHVCLRRFVYKCNNDCL
jgi:hypothetical protein